MIWQYSCGHIDPHHTFYFCPDNPQEALPDTEGVCPRAYIPQLHTFYEAVCERCEQNLQPTQADPAPLNNNLQQSNTNANTNASVANADATSPAGIATVAQNNAMTRKVYDPEQLEHHLRDMSPNYELQFKDQIRHLQQALANRREDIIPVADAATGVDLGPFADAPAHTTTAPPSARTTTTPTPTQNASAITPAANFTANALAIAVTASAPRINNPTAPLYTPEQLQRRATAYDQGLQ